MKIKSLLETTISSTPEIAATTAPKFGRDPNVLETSAGASCSGSMGASATAMPGMQRRSKNGSDLFRGIKTSKKFVNSPVTEDDISEEQLLDKQVRKELFNKSRDRELGNRPSDYDIITKEESGGGGEYNDEVDMVQNNLHTIVRVSSHLGNELQANENLPEWVQEKIAVAKAMMVTVLDYMKSQHERGEVYTVDESEKIHLPHFIPQSSNDFKGASRGRDTDKINIPSVARRTNTGNMSSAPKLTSPNNGEIDIDSILRDKGIKETEDPHAWMNDLKALAHKMYPQDKLPPIVQHTEKPRVAPYQHPNQSKEELDAGIRQQMAKYYSDNDDTHRHIGDSYEPTDTMLEAEPDFSAKFKKNIDKHNKAVVKTKKEIGTRVADIGPGGKEYNVKTDKEWDKQKGVAEAREFGSYYDENVAQQVFNQDPDITSEDEVLNRAYAIVKAEQGNKFARYKFNYDEDFPSDVVSNYFHLKKQGVTEMNVGKRKPKPDSYHINKDGKPVSLASYSDKDSAIKDRDEKHPGAEVHQVGSRGKVKGKFEEGMEAWESVEEVAPPGAKAERMVKHIKANYAKDGKLTPKEKAIAYATTWQAHNKGQVEENFDETDDVRIATKILQYLLKTNANMLRQYGDTVIGDAIVNVADWYHKNNQPLDIEKMSNTVVKLINKSFNSDISENERPGLWANIHAKQNRIKNGSGEHMRKPGSKGAPTKDAFRKSAK